MSEKETPAFEPMSFGMILDRAIQLYSRNFLLLVGISAVPEVLLSFSNLAGARTPVLNLLIMPAYLLLSAVATAAVAVAISARHLGREVTIAQCCTAAFRKLGTLLGAWILTGLQIAAGFLLVLVPGIIWALSYCLLTPVIMLEGLSAVDSRKRSWELTKGSRWQIFGLYLVYLLVSYGLVFLVGLVSRLTAGAVTGQGVISPLAQLISLAGRVLLAPFGGIVTVLIYYNQRIRKEGFDLELLAESLGEQ